MPQDIDRIAKKLLECLGAGRSLARHPGLDMTAARAVAERVRELRERGGETPVGRKIGFTNTTIWQRYGVDGPMWNYVFDSTVRDLGDRVGTVSLQGFSEPRLEPEIAFGLSQAPDPSMDEGALFECIAWVAPSFEIVQSVYPGWEFTAAESAAAFGLHGALLLGHRHDVSADRGAWQASLSDFSATLVCDGRPIETGQASNVLGGPLRALAYLVREIAGDPTAQPLRPGEAITTGTLTDAQPLRPGQRWRTEFAGPPLAGPELVTR